MTTSLLNQPLLSKEEYYSSVSSTCISAMRLRRFGERHSAYQQEIGSLAITCAGLMTHHKEHIQDIITHIEQLLGKEHKKELVIIDGEISTLFNRRKKTHTDTLYGENEIIDLTLKISFLERRRTFSFAVLVKGIVCDTLSMLLSEYDPQLLNDFNVNDYEYHDEFSITPPKKAQDEQSEVTKRL